jgi:hypothetical protein
MKPPWCASHTLGRLWSGDVSLLSRGATAWQRDVSGVFRAFLSEIQIANTQEFSVKQRLNMRERRFEKFVLAQLFGNGRR